MTIAVNAHGLFLRPHPIWAKMPHFRPEHCTFLQGGACFGVWWKKPWSEERFATPFDEKGLRPWATRGST